MKKIITALTLTGTIILLVSAYIVIKNINRGKSLIKTPVRTQMQPDNRTPSDASYPRISTLAEQLSVPWGIAFLPDNRLLVTERPGRISLIDLNTQSASAVKTFPVSVKPDGEGGLLGIALHPDFSNNQWVYVYYTYENTENTTQNRVVRMKFSDNTFGPEEIVIDKIPGNLYHNGGRIRFGPDGFLYVTTGDARDPSRAQDTRSRAGKILRVTDTGQAAPDNPFKTQIYSYGHRNPQGIAWDAAGNLWSTEHGRSNPSGYDELNLITAGGNYGWDRIQGDETMDGMLPAVLQSGADTTWAPAGTAIIDNSLFFTGLRSQTLYEAILGEENQIIELKKHLVGEYGRLREVIVGPDNMLYITTSNTDGRGNPADPDDRILRINPELL